MNINITQNLITSGTFTTSVNLTTQAGDIIIFRCISIVTVTVTDGSFTCKYYFNTSASMSYVASGTSVNLSVSPSATVYYAQIRGISKRTALSTTASSLTYDYAFSKFATMSRSIPFCISINNSATSSNSLDIKVFVGDRFYLIRPASYNTTISSSVFNLFYFAPTQKLEFLLQTTTGTKTIIINEHPFICNGKNYLDFNNYFNCKLVRIRSLHTEMGLTNNTLTTRDGNGNLEQITITSQEYIFKNLDSIMGTAPFFIANHYLY